MFLTVQKTIPLIQTQGFYLFKGNGKRWYIPLSRSHPTKYITVNYILSIEKELPKDANLDVKRLLSDLT